MEILVSTTAKLMKNNMEIGKNIETQWEEKKLQRVKKLNELSTFNSER